MMTWNVYKGKLINPEKFPKINMIDTTLIDKLTELAKKEKKLKEYKKRLRVKGRLVKKSLTKNKNIRLTIKKEDDMYKFIVLKSHKERFAIAEKLAVGKSVSIEGIPKFRMVICTKLKVLDKGIGEGRQEAVLRQSHPNHNH